MDNSLTIIIPAYNEEEALPEFLPQLIGFCEKMGYQAIIVNDGSRDGTLKVLEQFKNPLLQVVSHKVNRGYGGALKTGISLATTRYCITVDADGQHNLEDVKKLHEQIQATGADMIIGWRNEAKGNWYRELGKSLIRRTARTLLKFKLHDLNSGMKISETALTQRYLKLCPDGMAYSDAIALVFVSQRHLVLEEPITLNERVGGQSTISTYTAFETIKHILNMVIFFNPMRIFLPISGLFFLAGFAWGLPIILMGRGLSTAALLALLSGLIFFFLGLLSEQLAFIRKSLL
jgi:glycosyltransferase involved in cell wall biosynthesis